MVKIYVHVCIELLSCTIGICACACVGGCALAYFSVHPYFERCKTFSFGHVPVTVVLFGGMMKSF